MRYYVENDGQFTVEINFWKNTCDVWYETVKLNEVDKKTYELGKEKIVVTGTPFSGLYLYRGGKKSLIFMLKWYDYVACVLPVLVCMIFGSYIGFALGTVLSVLNYKIMPYVKSYPLRLLISMGFATVGFLIVALLAWAFPTLFGIKK